MEKLLVVCGPTSTGKTSLALRIAKKLNGELISADSRQVYRGMDIGTGKDLPVKAKLKFPLFSKYGYYEIDGVKIWGYDIADPKRDFSVAGYLKIAHNIIDNIARRGKLPILVGGTGLYIKGVIDGIPTADVPPNAKLRVNLEKRNASELFGILADLDSFKAASLNSSDKMNPRRLIRAIEVAQYHLMKKSIPVHHTIEKKYKVLFVGLKASKVFLDEQIGRRVEERLKAGIKNEIRKLLKKGLTWESQSMMSLGYSQWRDNFEGGVSEEVVINEWKKEERQYAKRQMTWFKKDPRIVWFDVTDSNFPNNVEKLVENWHNQENTNNAAQS